MQKSWDGVALGLLALGYCPLSYIELSCPTCGDWRGGIDPEYYSLTIPCPKCGKASDYAILGQGFSRKPSVEWELVSPALPVNCKGEWSGDATSERECRTAITGRPPDPETQHRIVLAAFLALRGATRQAMAEQIGVKAGAVFYCRNKTAIEREQERLRLLPETARRLEVERARAQIGRGMAF